MDSEAQTAHNHRHRAPADRVLVTGLVVTVVFALIEAIGGWWSGSLALLGDAGHMITDATALGLAAFAAWVSRQPPSDRHSYGLVRAEVVAALVNSLFMLIVVTTIAYHAIERLRHPQDVAGGVVMLIAAVGLLVNIYVAKILHGGEQTLNTRAALLHVMGDLLGSVAALLAGAIIYFTGWTPIDPILSFLISGLILWSSFRLLREVLHVIMEGVPPYLDLPEVGLAMAKAEGVASVHDLHIWTLSSGLVALSAHIVIDDMQQWETTLGRLKILLRERFAIEHITLQPESRSPAAVPIKLRLKQSHKPG